MKEPIKVALPKGRLLTETASLLREAGWGLGDYNTETRLYHLKSDCHPLLSAKIFNEKDIPVQVAIGNYDMGICGIDWLEELLAKYPSSPVINIKILPYGTGSLGIYTARFSSQPLNELIASSRPVRIASEYPNLAESFAAHSRFRQFRVYSLWGAAEVYPPENAELALIPDNVKRKYLNETLVKLSRVMEYSACIIANRSSWENKDMSLLLSPIDNGKAPEGQNIDDVPAINIQTEKRGSLWDNENIVRLAIPDGHQQSPTIELMEKAGIKIDNYVSTRGNGRPTSNLEGVVIKVIRPQDMPAQVANGNFDLAITGKDWLRNHVYQFPTSPVDEVLDLKSGWVRIVAVVSNNWNVNDSSDLRHFIREKGVTLRVASEYVNVADKYARDNHLGMYKIIPTWGATETFIPDDADVLIENTQTGKTLAKNNLKIIDTLFESTGCLIGRTNIKYTHKKEKRINDIIAKLSTVLQES